MDTTVLNGKILRLLYDLGEVYNLAQQYLSAYRHADEINSGYKGVIEDAYNRYTSSAYTYSVYLRYQIQTGYDDTLLGDIQKNLDAYTATDNTLYYFANDVDLSFGATLPGNAEFVIATDKPFSHDGAQNLNLVDTGKTMSLTSSTGFTRAVEIYEVLSDGETSKIESDYTAWGADQAELKDTYDALSVAITGQEIAVDEVGEYSPQGTDGSFLFTTPFPELLEGSWYCDTVAFLILLGPIQNVLGPLTRLPPYPPLLKQYRTLLESFEAEKDTTPSGNWGDTVKSCSKTVPIINRT